MITTLEENIEQHPPLLKSLNFHLLWWGTFISHSGTAIRMIALEWVVYAMTKDKELTALIPTAILLPMALLGLFTGTIIDMFNRKKLIIGCEFLMMLTALALGYAITLPGNNYPILLTLTFITGILFSFEAPARMSIGFFVFPKQELPRIIPLLALTFQAARFVGPFLGGILLAQFGPSLCFYINAATYGAIMLSILLVRFDNPPTKTASKHFKKEVFQGVKHVFANPMLRSTLLLTSTASLLGTAPLALMPAIAKDLLHQDAAGYGETAAAMGVGAIIALVLMTTLAKKPIRAKLFRGSILLLGIALAILSTTSSLPIAWICLVAIGLSEVLIGNICRTTLQMNTPKELQGRVVALEGWAIYGVLGIGCPIFGWLANQIGLTPTMMIGSAAMLVCSIVGIRISDLLKQMDH
jgi:MFS family permease